MKIRKPKLSDGRRIWRLVRDSGVLDINSAYCYLLQCRDYADTAAVAEDADGLAGFVTGYRPPERPDVWFVWQIGVAPRARGQGLAKRLLRDVLTRHDDLRHVEATIEPGNQASRALFASLANELSAPMLESDGFEAHHFPDGHEPEPRIHIGPFSPPYRERPLGGPVLNRLSEVRQ
ncbi:diaminobutyrate acetyltransferase [Acidihalobacter prosperus]|uniref:L-2,4-diaminobutyric acid acetyltransferase n=1 Tax=Acidihalobacter prosperus TaxID=160660 RepID=A0A1A6C6R5_9GAMM|nr:diaminobutyrate acetyltransferase [Acidihalobacter prosperus]OBS10252.1 L-2,4-diaminobutyric acid acetyltransferase [Acidihalobacter prosperus]